MQTFREVIYDCINVWGSISVPELEDIMASRFKGLPNGIVFNIVLELLRERLLVQNINYSFSTKEYCREKETFDACHI